MKKLRILIVDDHAVIQKALKCLVDVEPDMEVVGEAGDGHEACRQAAVLQPDVILMDLGMPNMSGEEATRHIKRNHPAIKIIALTAQEDHHVKFNFLEDDLSIAVNRKQFEDAIHNEVVKISDAATDCLKQASVKSVDIDLVILTGGSTEIPIVQSAFKKLFPRAAVADENKLSSVGMGLAYDSLKKFL